MENKCCTEELSCNCGGGNITININGCGKCCCGNEKPQPPVDPDPPVDPKPEPGQPLDPDQVYEETRPKDWLPMPEPQDNEMYLLFHIPDGYSSLIAFTATCTGSYKVELGTVASGLFVANEAMTQTIASGTAYQSELFATDFGSLTSTGMKQCMIKVSGTNILTWQPTTHFKKSNPIDFAVWNIVEIRCKLTTATKVACGQISDTFSLKHLRYFLMSGTNNMIDMKGMFSHCTSLICIPHLDTTSAIDMSYMFYHCNSLASIPLFETTSVTDMSYLFYMCTCLKSVPRLETVSVTDMSYMFSYCNSLASVPLFETANVTNMTEMFRACTSLKNIPCLDTANATNMFNMFANCTSLTSITKLDTANVTSTGGMFSRCASLASIPSLDTASVTDMGSMLADCTSLSSVPWLDTTSVSNMSNMFYNCAILTNIPQLDTTNVTYMKNMLSGCMSLVTLKLTPSSKWATPQEISLFNCSLSRQAIIDFFTNLPSINITKAIILTGNPGALELTIEDKAIATNKGWALTL